MYRSEVGKTGQMRVEGAADAMRATQADPRMDVATGLVQLRDRAERRGLARRVPVPGDRRALQATLTDTGRR